MRAKAGGGLFIPYEIIRCPDLSDYTIPCRCMSLHVIPYPCMSFHVVPLFDASAY